jgi:hypothetical protein
MRRNKFQISNPKFQTISNNQIPIEQVWGSNIGIYLDIGAWSLEFQGAEH